MNIFERLASWRDRHNYLAVGNLGEHVTAHLLISLGYQILGAQDDFVGMVPEVLGTPTRANPEDFIAIDPEGRLVTINSKASISPRTCRITPSGNLSKPRLGEGQNETRYSTLRANLISPVDGDSFAQVVKVDLRNLKAQIFEIGDDGRLFAVDGPHGVADVINAVLIQFPHHVPPPRVWDLT
jgi:hypothetical protein